MATVREGVMPMVRRIPLAAVKYSRQVEIDESLLAVFAPDSRHINRAR